MYAIMGTRNDFGNATPILAAVSKSIPCGTSDRSATEPNPWHSERQDSHTQPSRHRAAPLRVRARVPGRRADDERVTRRDVVARHVPDIHLRAQPTNACRSADKPLDLLESTVRAEQLRTASRPVSAAMYPAAVSVLPVVVEKNLPAYISTSSHVRISDGTTSRTEENCKVPWHAAFHRSLSHRDRPAAIFASRLRWAARRGTSRHAFPARAVLMIAAGTRSAGFANIAAT